MSTFLTRATSVPVRAAPTGFDQYRDNCSRLLNWWSSRDRSLTKLASFQFVGNSIGSFLGELSNAKFKPEGQAWGTGGNIGHHAHVNGKDIDVGGFHHKFMLNEAMDPSTAEKIYTLLKKSSTSAWREIRADGPAYFKNNKLTADPHAGLSMLLTDTSFGAPGKSQRSEVRLIIEGRELNIQVEFWSYTK